MRKAILCLTVMLAVMIMAPALMANIPATPWITDHFDVGWTDFGRALKNYHQTPDLWSSSGGTAGDLQVVSDMSGGSHSSSFDANVVPNTATNCVTYKGISGNGGDAYAETSNAAQASMGAASVGQVQIMHFMGRTGTQYTPPVVRRHGSIFMRTSNNTQIGGWIMSSTEVVARLMTTGPDKYSYAMSGTAYHDFDCKYNPVSGTVTWSVDNVAVATAAQTAGLSVCKVYLYDVVDGNNDTGHQDQFWLDDLSVGTESQPAVTYPTGGASIGTNTPTVAWNHAYPTPAPTDFQVRVCQSDNPNGVVNQDSGIVSGAGGTYTTAALTPQVQLWAFVKENYAGTGWTGWSPVGNGGFICNVSAPNIPTMTGPTGTVVGAKPMTAFTGDAHSNVHVKITTDFAGNSIVWDSGEVSATGNGLACTSMLSEGSYFAFAKIGNGIGWCANWSGAIGFSLTRTGEGRDTRHMNEQVGANNILLHSGLAPNDGFGTWMFGQTNVNWSHFRHFTDRNCDNGYVVIECQTTDGNKSCMLRKHRVANIDLDKGVTLLAGYMIADDSADFNANEPWLQGANFVVCDANAGVSGTENVMASFRVARNQVAIFTNGVWTSFGANIGRDWQIVRITGRNRVKGLYSTCEWKLYLNENTVPLATATGCNPSTAIDSNTWMTEDCIGIGSGAFSRIGAFMFDYTDVNMSGDYSPSEWGGIASVNVSSIGQAKDGGMTAIGVIKPAGCEVKYANITGLNAIITKDVGATQYYAYHGYTNGSSINFDDEVSNVHAFYLQDLVPGGGAICVMANESQTDIAQGKKVTAFSGRIQQAMATQEYWHEANWSEAPANTGYVYMHYRQMGDWDVVGAIGLSPTLTISTDPAVAVKPEAMSQRNLACANCVSSMPQGAGNVGRFALVTGSVTWVDPAGFNSLPFPNGSYSVVIDDGSNLLNYPRESGSIGPVTADFNNYNFPADVMAPEGFKGLRVTIDCNTVMPGGTYDADSPPHIGDHLLVTGMVGYHSFWEYWKAPMTITERTLLYPVVTKY